MRVGSSLLVPALAVLVAAGCASVRNAAGGRFEPATPGVLTVATAFLPAPGFWEGTPPTRGFEAGLALALAHKLGLSKVHVIQVPFARIVSGHLDGADLALSQLTPTKEREKVLDFSDPYLAAPPGVLTAVGVDAPDVHALQELQWVTSRTSTLTPIVMNRVRPGLPPVQTEDRTAALQVLRSGRAQALLLDLPVALGLAHDDPSTLQVVAQLDGDEALAAALPNGSPNEQIVDSSIRALVADGTVDDLAKRWLGNQDNVPLILTQG